MRIIAAFRANSMEQNRALEADSRVSGQEILRF
jgi:hypothetical protein